VTGLGVGSLNGISYGLVENLTGGNGDDTFVMGINGRVTGILNGGAGVNVLDYSSRSNAVAVNLAGPTFSATSVSTMTDTFAIVLGGSANDTLVGSSTLAMVLVGGAGNDQLTGQGLNDILIGGLGVDTLNGQGGQDVVIGGRVTFDTNVDALRKVRAEWVEPTRIYQQRIDNLMGTTSGGNNGSWYLRNSITPADDTLLDDGAVDTLLGGSELDWFIGAVNDLFSDLNDGSEFKTSP
jgi:Ca2+-binding RTX toxin-like protein